MILYSTELLYQVVAELRRQARTIVFTPGCFDMLHAGHVALLRDSRRQGDFLIVATNTDESIRRAKGAERPIVPLSDRLAMLDACRYVDAVISYDEDTPEELCRIIRPNVMTKGLQYSGAYLPGEKFCGRVHLCPMLPQRSTTGLTTSILDRAAVPRR